MTDDTTKVDAVALNPILQEVIIWVGGIDGTKSIAFEGTCASWEIRATQPPPDHNLPPEFQQKRVPSITLYLDDPKGHTCQCTLEEFIADLSASDFKPITSYSMKEDQNATNPLP